MGATFFGQYLLSKGIIDREALIEAIDTQRRQNLSLTTLAVQHGYIDQQQEQEILSRYRKTDSKLDDLCLESGYLDRRQLDELTRVQYSDWMRIGTALVAGGHLTFDDVEEHLEVFQETQRRAEKQIEADFSACLEPQTVRTVVTLAIMHLGRIIDQPVKLRSISNGTGNLAAGMRRYEQRFVGDRELHIALDLPADMDSVVAQGLIGMPLETGSEAAIDAVCELVNIIGGNACTHFESLGFKLRPEPPFSTVEGAPVTGNRPSYHAEVLVGETEVDVQVFL
jgi:hypothetical protein